MNTYDLISPPKPGISASSFTLNDTIDDILLAIGDANVITHDSGVGEHLENHAEWVRKRHSLGFDGSFYETLVYKKGSIELQFQSGVLTDIILGSGYMGNFLGLHIGDQLPKSIQSYDIIFNDQQDEFLFKEGDAFLNGISIGTDYRSSLENAPLQLVQKIRVFR
jgi:hypothetical protein